MTPTSSASIRLARHLPAARDGTRFSSQRRGSLPAGRLSRPAPLLLQVVLGCEWRTRLRPSRQNFRLEISTKPADAGAPALLTRTALREHLRAHDAHVPRCRLAR